MNRAQKATLFLTCVLLCAPAISSALSDQADKMCKPYIAECPCNQIPNPNKLPGQPKCVQGGFKNSAGYSNTHSCGVGVCVDTTNGHKTEGICVAENKCEGKITDGKPVEKPDVKVDSSQNQTTTGGTQTQTGGLPQNQDVQTPEAPNQQGSILDQLLQPKPEGTDQNNLSPSAQNFYNQIQSIANQPGILDRIESGITNWFSGGPSGEVGGLQSGITPENLGSIPSNANPMTGGNTNTFDGGTQTFGGQSSDAQSSNWFEQYARAYQDGSSQVATFGEQRTTQPIGGAFDARTTFYGPGAGGTVQGGFETSRPGLDGEYVPRTLDDVRLGKADAVTLATAPENYGKYYDMGAVTYKSNIDGVTYTGDKDLAAAKGYTYSENLENVTGYAHDTGAAFRAGGCGAWGTCGERLNKFDVAVGDFRGWSGGEAYKFLVSQGQEFGGNRLNEFQQIAGLPSGSTNPWGSGPVASTYQPQANWNTGGSPIAYSGGLNPYPSNFASAPIPQAPSYALMEQAFPVTHWASLQDYFGADATVPQAQVPPNTVPAMQNPSTPSYPFQYQQYASLSAQQSVTVSDAFAGATAGAPAFQASVPEPEWGDVFAGPKPPDSAFDFSKVRDAVIAESHNIPDDMRVGTDFLPKQEELAQPSPQFTPEQIKEMENAQLRDRLALADKEAAAYEARLKDLEAHNYNIPEPQYVSAEEIQKNLEKEAIITRLADMGYGEFGALPDAPPAAEDVVTDADAKAIIDNSPEDPAKQLAQTQSDAAACGEGDRGACVRAGVEQAPIDEQKLRDQVAAGESRKAEIEKRLADLDGSLKKAGTIEDLKSDINTLERQLKDAKAGLGVLQTLRNEWRATPTDAEKATIGSALSAMKGIPGTLGSIANNSEFKDFDSSVPKGLGESIRSLSAQAGNLGASNIDSFLAGGKNALGQGTAFVNTANSEFGKTYTASDYNVRAFTAEQVALRGELNTINSNISYYNSQLSQAPVVADAVPAAPQAVESQPQSPWSHASNVPTVLAYAEANGDSLSNPWSRSVIPYAPSASELEVGNPYAGEDRTPVAANPSVDSQIPVPNTDAVSNPQKEIERQVFTEQALQMAYSERAAAEKELALSKATDEKLNLSSPSIDLQRDQRRLDTINAKIADLEGYVQGTKAATPEIEQRLDAAAKGQGNASAAIDAATKQWSEHVQTAEETLKKAATGDINAIIKSPAAAINWAVYGLSSAVGDATKKIGEALPSGEALGFRDSPQGQISALVNPEKRGEEVFNSGVVLGSTFAPKVLAGPGGLADDAAAIAGRASRAEIESATTFSKAGDVIATRSVVSEPVVAVETNPVVGRIAQTADDIRVPQETVVPDRIAVGETPGSSVSVAERPVVEPTAPRTNDVVVEKPTPANDNVPSAPVTERQPFPSERTTGRPADAPTPAEYFSQAKEYVGTKLSDIRERIFGRSEPVETPSAVPEAPRAVEQPSAPASSSETPIASAEKPSFAERVRELFFGKNEAPKAGEQLELPLNEPKQPPRTVAETPRISEQQPELPLTRQPEQLDLPLNKPAEQLDLPLGETPQPPRVAAETPKVEPKQLELPLNEPKQLDLPLSQPTEQPKTFVERFKEFWGSESKVAEVPKATEPVPQRGAAAENQATIGGVVPNTSSATESSVKKISEASGWWTAGKVVGAGAVVMGGAWGSRYISNDIVGWADSVAPKSASKGGSLAETPLDGGPSGTVGSFGQKEPNPSGIGTSEVPSTGAPKIGINDVRKTLGLPSVQPNQQPPARTDVSPHIQPQTQSSFNPLRYMGTFGQVLGSLIGRLFTQQNQQPQVQPQPSAPTTPTTPTIPRPQPVATIAVNPSVVASGTRATLSWTSAAADSCSVTDPRGFVLATTTAGSTTTPPLATTTAYTILCSSSAGSASAKATATVQ